jgi:hypothetical protein
MLHRIAVRVPDHLPVKVQRVILASLKRINEIADERGEYPGIYETQFPVLVATSFSLYPKLSEEERYKIILSCCDFFIEASDSGVRLALHRGSSH